MALFTLGGRSFEVAPATLADQRAILKIQREAMKRAESEGQFSDAHIDAALDVALVLLKAPELRREDLAALFPGRAEKWQAEIRRLYVAADLVDETSPGEAVSP